MTEPYFDRLHPKYKCCCNLLHVETGTKIICGLALFGYIFSFVNYFSNGLGNLWGNMELARIVLGTCLILGPLIGIKQTKPHYFLPYLCYMSVMMLSYALQLPIWFAAYYPNSTLGHELRKWVRLSFPKEILTEADIDDIVTGVILTLAMALLLKIWFFCVIFKCYKYVNDKFASGYNEISIPQLRITSNFN